MSSERTGDAGGRAASPDAANAATPLPDRIGTYRVIRRLGAGGMGEVFLAVDERLHRQVAVKRALPSALPHPQADRRLLTEARAAAQLDHPHICAIFEVGEDAGVPFIVMPVVEGETLDTRLRSGPLPVADAVDIAAQIADALVAAHARGILHRDIKPANLILNTRGQVRVMDFGLARLHEPGEAEADTISRLTASGSAIGTAPYMSPEQARGERVDARTDLFSLGVVLYEMLAGRRPFRGGSFAETVASTLNDEPASLVRQRPDIPDELARIVAKALRKSRDERYQSATDLLVDLRALLRVLQSGPGTAVSVRVPIHRRWPVIAGMAALVVTAAALTVWRVLSPRPGFDEEIHSLLVLPLVNDTGDAQKDYVADAITESVIRDLSHLPNLKVMGRQTAFQFKGKNLTPQQIARTVPVRAVMSGTLRRAGDQLTIDVELSDTRDGSVIISRRYLEPATQAARIEVDITQDLARDLRVQLSGPDARRLATISTANGEAYQLHLRAAFFEGLGTPAGYHQAVTLNQQALAIDRNYALAWLDLAQADLLLGIYFEAARDWMPQAKIAALEALRVDPDSSDAHVVLGLLAMIYDWDLATAERELVTSAGVNPRTIDTFSCTVHLLQSLRKPGEAGRELQQAMVADPLSGSLRTEVGCNAYYERHYDEAVAGYRAALEIDPRNEVALWGLGRAYGQLKQYGDALDALAKVDAGGGMASPLTISERGYALAREGRTSEARHQLDLLNGLKDHIYVNPYLVAVVYAGLGDAPRTLSSLEAAYRDRSGLMISMSAEPKWDFIRDNPAFVDLQRRIGS